MIPKVLLFALLALEPACLLASDTPATLNSLELAGRQADIFNHPDHPFVMDVDFTVQVAQPKATLEEGKCMKIVKMLKSLVAMVAPSENAEIRSIVILQRKAHRFTEEELRTAGEHGWEKRFDGREDPLYFVSADQPALTVVKAGPYIIRVTSAPARYADDDEYALSQLPHPEQRKAWTEHRACTYLEFFNDLPSRPRSIPDAEAYAALAKLALQLGDPNCTAVFVPIKNMMMPNDGTAEKGLRLMINKKFSIKR